MSEVRSDTALSPCLDEATVAEFVEGTLDRDRRARVVAHIASCEGCCELVAEVVARNDELGTETRSEAATWRVSAGKATAQGVWARRRAVVAVGGLAALAASVFLTVVNRRSGLEPLVQIVGEQRLTLARPTGGFEYGPLRSPLRGSNESGNLRLLGEAARLRERSDRTSAPADQHAAGIALMLAGDLDGAVRRLESAVGAKPEEPAFLVDLGAAYMTRFVNLGEDADGDRALGALDKVLALAPDHKEAWFNKAVLLERMGRPSEALAAWDRYLALPAEPGWREEGIRAREALQRQLNAR